MAEIVLTKENFMQEVILSKEPVLIDFWADWCEPCRMLAPIIEEIAAEKDGEIKVGKVNVDEQPELAQVFNASSIPMLALVKNRRVAAAVVGYVPKERVEQMFENLADIPDADIKKGKHRVAVTYEGGEIFQHFGHTEQFKVYDLLDGQIVSSEVRGADGAGHEALADLLYGGGVDILICGGIGGGAQQALAQAGITLYGGCSGNADEAVEALIAGTLGYDPNVHCDHHDHEDGHSCGEGGCGHHHEEGHECGCGKDGEKEDHECGCGKDEKKEGPACGPNGCK